MRQMLYWALLACVVAIAWWRGDRDLRAAASVCLLATIGSLHTWSPAAFDGVPVAVTVAIIDGLTLAAFIAIALRSNDFWPLWIAGLQLTATLSHILRMIAPELGQLAYAAAMKMWSYPLLVILGVAAWRHRPALPQPAEASAPA